MKFEEFIKKNKKDMEYEEDLSSVWNGIESDIFIEPGSSKAFKPNRIILIASIIALCSLMVYFSFSRKESLPDQMALNNQSYVSLENQKPLEKILTIKTNQFPNKNQEQIIETLLSIVENDQNTNVRLAAIRSLEKFIEVEKVKISFIELLGDEEEPYLTVAIMNILQRGKVTESLPAFNRVIQTENRMNFVKEEAIKGQDLLKNI